METVSTFENASQRLSFNEKTALQQADCFVLFAGRQQCRSHSGGGVSGVRLPPAPQWCAQQEGCLLHWYEMMPLFLSEL